MPSVRKRGREIPDPRVSRGEAKQCAAWRSPSRGKPTTALYSEIPTCDCLSRVRHVPVHQLRLAFHLKAAEGRYRLKTTRRQLGVCARCCRLTSLSASTTSNASSWKRNQTGCGQCAAVLPVGGENSGRGRVQQRLHIIQRHIDTLRANAREEPLGTVPTVT
jgi:hypothetical protein